MTTVTLQDCVREELIVIEKTISSETQYDELMQLAEQLTGQLEIVADLLNNMNLSMDKKDIAQDLYHSTHSARTMVYGYLWSVGLVG